MPRDNLAIGGMAISGPGREDGDFPRLWLALAFLGFAAVLATNAWFPDPQRAGFFNFATRFVIHAAVLGGLWLGLTRTSFELGTRLKVWLAVAVPFVLWVLAVYWLALTGAFRPRPLGWFPVPAAIFGPVLVGLPILLRSKRIGAVLDATPASWLVALQVYRILGGTFLIAWANGDLGSVFALPAGIGDVTVGLLAIAAAYLLSVGAPRARALAVTWNILGLLDFTVAVGIGLLTALQIIVPDRPNLALGLFPAVMIPAFAVPSSILLHALSIRQLLRTKGGPS